MSIATFESPQVASQQFFPWLFEEDETCEYSAAETIEEFEIAPKIASQPPAQAAWVPSLGGETRIGKTVLLGTVMIKLLKSYGISDAEIAEGMAAYAAQAGLAQAG
jgi:hypothetical protein